MSIEHVRWATALVALSLACGPRGAPKPSAAEDRHFAGRVTHADGTPSSGAVVIISDSDKGDVLATALSGPDGRFATRLVAAVYAVTATDETESVFTRSVEGRRGDIEIRLGTTCVPFAGRLQTTSRIPHDAVIRLVRSSDTQGDTFGAAVASDGAFRACLPPAMYGIESPEGFVSRDSMFDVPYHGTLEYRTDLQRDADRIPTDVSGIAPESVDAFVSAFPASTRVLGLGESNHGTREFYEERTALVKKLASKHGVRLLMIEAGYGEVIALDEYVNGATLDVVRTVQDLGYWIYDTKTFLQTLAELRTFNASLPIEQRIHLIGFDVQDTGASIRYLVEQGSAVLTSEQANALEPLATESGKAWMTLTPEQRNAIRATLARVANASVTGNLTSQPVRTVLAARSLILRFDALEAPSRAAKTAIRDAGMARMVTEVLARAPGTRATLWAHLGHLGREAFIGERTMGAYLTDALGAGYRAYGLFAAGGSARAWDAPQAEGVIANTLIAPPAYSLESVLAKASGGAPVTYWTFAMAKGEAARWLQGVHALREFGAVFPRAGREFSYWDLRTFDGAILFSSVSPTDPTPTGERRAKPKTP